MRLGEKLRKQRDTKEEAPGLRARGPPPRSENRPCAAGGALLSHGLTPQYHRRWGA